MEFKHAFLAALFILAVIAPFAVQSFAQENNETEVKMAEILLSKTTYLPNETLQGKIRLFLDEPVSSDEEIKLRLSMFAISKESSISLKDALNNASIDFKESLEKKEVTNEASSKTLSFVGSGTQYIAVKLPRGSNIESVDMDISAPSGSQLTDVRIDIGDDDDIDWYYLGSFTGWEDSFVKPEGLKEVASQEITIDDNETLYCQMIDIPYSVDYNLTANYKSLGGGNIHAAVLRITEPLAPQYPASTMLACDLPEHSEFKWGSCSLHTDYGLTGKNFVCVYSNISSDTEMYALNVFQNTTTTAYACDMTDPTSIECQSMNLLNPFIKMKGAKYSKVLNKAVDFSKWEYSPEALLISFWEVVGSPDPPEPHTGFMPKCEDLECVIPLKVYADGTGLLTFENLDIKYTYAGATSHHRTFFDLRIKPREITGINTSSGMVSLDTENMTLELPLSIFNITVPKPVAAGKSEVKLSFMGNEANATLSVTAPGVKIGSEQIISETKDALNALASAADDTKLVLGLLEYDIDTALSELDDYSTKLALGDTSALQTELEEFRAALPKEVLFESGYIDYLYIEPDDIIADVVPADRKEETYFLQSKAQVKASISAFVITDFSGTETRYSLVKKELVAKAPLSRIDVYEVIGKSVADSVDDIKFEKPPSQVVEKDPIVKWFVQSLSTGAKESFNYIIETGFDVDINDIDTIIVAAEAEIEPPMDEAECGDGICTSELEDEVSCPGDCEKRSPWGIIVIIIFIALLLAAYILFYKGKFSLQELFKGKMPFASKSQLKIVMDYIQSSRSKKMNDVQISRKLLEKGWKEEQIKYAFKEIKAAKRIDLTPMKSYIKAATAKGMKKELIAKKLVLQGWDKEIVNKELGLKK